jgi:hypothetical protein
LHNRTVSFAEIIGSIVLAALMLLLSPIESAAQELSKLPYVPTPQLVVDEMLKLAGVTSKDFVIDLGSGDGRVILTAARDFRATGLGVDIDAKLVELANKQAKADGLAERAKFIEQDMFKADVGKASVVTLYVLPDFMEKLRPKLLSELKPGVRIVAHDYYMSGWHPDKRLTLTVPEKVAANGTDKAYIYLWIVPSVVDGDWRLDFDPGGEHRQLIVLTLNQRYQMLNGSAANKFGAMKVEDAKLAGNQIDFFLTVGSTAYRFSGAIDGDKMEGSAVAANTKPIRWRASKLPPEGK